MTKSKHTKTHALAREIGAYFQPGRDAPDDAAFMAAWTRALARIVGEHTWQALHAYSDLVCGGADEIAAADDDALTDICARIKGEIRKIDDDDGWPADRAGNALNAVCLAWKYALDDTSRWPAEAGKAVWRFVAGATAHNEITSISADAWLRRLFTQVEAIATNDRRLK